MPLTFKVGVGEIVVKGMDDAVADMRKGEKRTLIVPWWLGYGEQGKPPEIPPRTTLIYEVELVDFSK